MKKLWQIVLVLFLTLSTAHAVRIVSVTAVGSGNQCPKTMRIRGEFKVVVPGIFHYQFLYSDGRKSPKYRKSFGPGKHTVTTQRRFHQSFDGWVKLKVSSPVQKATSSPKHFRVRCTTAGGGSTGHIRSVKVLAPPPSSLRCPTDYTVRGRIRLDGPATVRYRFRRQDGVASPVKVVHYQRGGVHSVRHTWHLTHTVNTRVRLEVLAPERVNSAYAQMKVRCRGNNAGGGRGLVNNVTITPIPPSTSNCPTRLKVKGSFWHAPMTKVRFRFVREDGVRSPWVSRTFNGAGYFHPEYTWRIERTTHTRVRLQVRYRSKLALPGNTWKTSYSGWTPLRINCRALPPEPSATLHASPSHFTGHCPKKIHFSGTIHFNRSGTVRYRFIRSDGAKGPIKTLHFNQPGTRHVSMDWHLGQSMQNGWVRIKILSPVVRYSPRAYFTLRCIANASVTDAFIQLAPTQHRGNCPVTINVQGRFRVTGPATVRYRFRRSDGASTPVKTLHADHAGTYDVWSSWTLGRDYDGWMRLEVLSPTHRFSRRAHFSIRCEAAGGHGSQGSGQGESNIVVLLPPGMPGIGFDSTSQGTVYTVVDESEDTAQQPSESPRQPGEGSASTRGEASDIASTENAELNGSAPTNDRDGDGLDDTLEARLLDRYRPYFLFAEGEKFLPSDPVYQVRHARLLSEGYEEGTPALRMPREIPGCGGLEENPLVLLSCGTPAADLPSTPTASAYALDLNDSLRSDPGTGKAGDWDGAVATAAGLYGHVAPDGPLVKLEYWQFFPYAERNASAHEGDWQLLELWVDPSDESLRKVCHRFHLRKACFAMEGARKVPLEGNLLEFRGTDYNATLPPVDPASAERYPAAYQNRAVRFFEYRGELHPAVYVEKGSHAFWPTPEGSYPGAADHNGTGHRYLSALRGAEANLGELTRPLPAPESPHALILRYAGHWGAWHDAGTSLPYGPTLHCDWKFPASEESFARQLGGSCSY
jgi:hypothetical protein